MLQTELNGIGIALKTKENCILELKVNNHPGVMSHICGLFARRAFNLEKIICFPIGNGAESQIYLMVGFVQSLNQVINQLMKLEDVHQVSISSTDESIFSLLERLIYKENIH